MDGIMGKGILVFGWKIYIIIILYFLVDFLERKNIVGYKLVLVRKMKVCLEYY